MQCTPNNERERGGDSDVVERERNVLVHENDNYLCFLIIQQQLKVN
jgi:hypothetical protein